MTVIHVTGCQACGKTTVISKFAGRKNVKVFNMTEFYKDAGCFRADNTMDWDKYKESNDILQDELTLFLTQDDNMVKIVESSGIGMIVNKILERYNPVVLRLDTPVLTELLRRDKAIGRQRKQTLEFHELYKNKSRLSGLNHDTAALVLQSYIEPMRICVSGIAKPEIGEELTKRDYYDMYSLVKSELKHFNKRNITLVSGCFPYAEHVSVSMFLTEEFAGLEFYSPITFQKTHFNKKIIMGKLFNTLHNQFSQSLGSDDDSATMKGIQKAIAKGATLTVSDTPEDKVSVMTNDLDYLIVIDNHNDGSNDTSSLWLNMTKSKKHLFLKGG